MNSKKKENKDYTNPEFADLFTFSSEEDEINSEARLISFHFLSEIEKLHGAERGMKTKLASGTGNSKSFITQLFNGDKLVNLPLLARFQKLLGIKFKIIAYPTSEFKYTSEPATIVVAHNIFIFNNTDFNSKYTEANISVVGSVKSVPSENIRN